MTQATRFSQLSAPKKALVRLLQSMKFGSVESLEIRGGEPVFNPPPTVLLEVKLDSESELRPELALTDFELRAEVTRLMAQLELLDVGSVDRIDVRHGIPWRAVIESPLNEVRR